MGEAQSRSGWHVHATCHHCCMWTHIWTAPSFCFTHGLVYSFDHTGHALCLVIRGVTVPWGWPCVRSASGIKWWWHFGDSSKCAPSADGLKWLFGWVLGEQGMSASGVTQVCFLLMSDCHAMVTQQLWHVTCCDWVMTKGDWEIWDRVAEVWGKIDPESCQNLIESMPRRVEAVIKAKGVIQSTRITGFWISDVHLQNWFNESLF